MDLQILVRGTDPPGRTFASYGDVHVGVQVDRDPFGMVPADTAAPQWPLTVRVVAGDFRGPAVQGRRGERFVYLTWGELRGGTFTMFRRAKLMLLDVPDPDRPSVTARVDLTDERGMPRCARLRAPALAWP